jgi:hypothetical protein
VFYGPNLDPQFVTGPTGTVAETMPRTGPLIAAASLTSGTLRLTGCYLKAGNTVTNIGFMTATGLTTPTNWWFGLYDSARTGLRLTADQTSTAWGNNAAMVVALTAPFVTTYTGLHYIGILIAAGAAGTHFGVQPTNTGPQAQAPLLSGQSTTGLTAPPAPGAAGGVGGTAGALTAAGSYCYAWLT